MKDRIVPQDEINEGYIVFCKDLGVEGERKEEIDKYLQEHNIVVEQKEDERLIWFEQVEDGEVKYYSNPIEKYISEPDQEIKFYIKSDDGFMLHLFESAMPRYYFRQKRKGKIPPIEESREKRKDYIDKYQRHIDDCFEFSVFGYILFDGKVITYPHNNNNSIIFVYKGKDKSTVEYYNDIEVLKELLSNKDRYAWYKLEENKYFIVRNSNKTEYQYLVDEESQEIKLAKIIGNKIVIEDIVKDELTLKFENEIDNNLSQSSAPIFGSPYIRFENNCFEVLKLKKISVEVDKNEFSLFDEPDYRIEGKYKKIETGLRLEEIEKVVINGNKYKWFKYRGKLYIAWMPGKSKKNVLLDDYIKDYFDAPECRFNYNNSPEDMVNQFIKNGIWDGDKIIEKYNCSQECIDNIVRDLIYRRHIERNEDGSNQYKITEELEHLSYMVYLIESELKL